jgi:hypothetical protein
MKLQQNGYLSHLRTEKDLVFETLCCFLEHRQ